MLLLLLLVLLLQLVLLLLLLLLLLVLLLLRCQSLALPQPRRAAAAALAADASGRQRLRRREAASVSKGTGKLRVQAQCGMRAKVARAAEAGTPMTGRKSKVSNAKTASRRRRASCARRAQAEICQQDRNQGSGHAPLGKEDCMGRGRGRNTL